MSSVISAALFSAAQRRGDLWRRRHDAQLIHLMVTTPAHLADVIVQLRPIGCVPPPARNELSGKLLELLFRWLCVW
jgi:hypothetical protein